MQRRGFSGQGRGYPLTPEEQKNLRDRILLATNNGKDLTVRSIQDFISEEAQNIIREYPERSKDLSKFIDPSHDKAYYFARKQGLDKIIKETDKRKNILDRKIFECDMCALTFTVKSSMIHHKRKAHLYFLEK